MLAALLSLSVMVVQPAAPAPPGIVELSPVLGDLEPTFLLLAALEAIPKPRQ